ncbi:MAG TPA: amidohydrolase family protein [Clostridia bacterium]|nr:amidohydrolase family protein [Clostridia bacterium]
MHDLKITNAKIPDFSSNSFYLSDIVINKGKIEKIGTTNEYCKMEIDAEGNIASPGFIDIHMHEEELDMRLDDPYCTSYYALLMGVTTNVGGNCGSNRQSLACFSDYINKNGAPTNYMIFLGHNSLRSMVGINDRYRCANKSEINKMKEIIRENKKYNYIGLSFGIEYSPGTSFDEMIGIISALEEDKYLLAAHYREDGENSIEAIKELIELSKTSKLPMQISHIGSCCAFGYMAEALEVIENAIEHSIDVMADCYPYSAFATAIGSAVFDEGCFERWNKTYSDILLLENPYRNARCSEELFYKVRKQYPEMWAAAFVMNEKEIVDPIKSPYVLIGSDSSFRKDMGHPRGAGCYPRVLSYYVKEHKELTLIDALRKMTIGPAKRLKLKNKGDIFEGADADIVIFDKDTIKDKASFENPTLPPVGIEYVILNGEIAVNNNKIISKRLGKYIKNC